MTFLTELLLDLIRLLLTLSLYQHPLAQHLDVILPTFILTVTVFTVYCVGSTLTRWEKNRH